MKISPYTFLENASIKDYIIQQYNEGYKCGMFGCIAAPDTPNANESWGYQVWWALSVNDSLVSVLITRSYTAKIWSRFLYVYAGNEKWVNGWSAFATESYVDNKVFCKSIVLSVPAGATSIALIDNFYATYGDAAVCAANGDYLVCPVQVVGTYRSGDDDKLYAALSGPVANTTNMRINMAIIRE